MRPRWQTPEAALRDALRSPLRARSTDHARPRTGSAHAAEEAMEAYTQVWAILAQYTDEERGVMLAHAAGLSRRATAKQMRCSEWRVRRIMESCWGPVCDRLVSLGLVSEGASRLPA